MEKIIYVDRKNTNCSKWDGLQKQFGSEGLLAMWVADMDFQIPACVKDALHQYVDHGVVGYYKIPDSYYEAFIRWEETHHGFSVRKEWIRFSPGVVSALNWIVNCMTSSGDSIIVMRPVYYPFFDAVNNNGRKLIVSDLVNKGGVYTIDFDDFEQKIARNNVKLFILCSPHNPVGRVWTRSELEKVFEICKKHNVFVIADEIHHDLVFADHQNIPAYSIGNYIDMMISVTSPSKTFNLAGAQNSMVIIADETLRKKWDDHVSGIRLLRGNTFGYIAAEAAYTGGEDWYQSAKKCIYENYIYLKAVLNEQLPNAVITPLEGTYLAWIDLRKCAHPAEVKQIVIDKCKLAVDFGDWFGGELYEGFIRINLATSLENIKTAASRLVEEFR